MWRSFGLLLVIAIGLLQFPAPATAEWIWIKQNKSDKLIVFVHGLRGDPKTSFGEEGRSWPELMAADTAKIRGAPALSSYSIVLLGYPAGSGDRLNIQEIAYRLLVESYDREVFDAYKDIIFVTHSLGGLIVKDLLVTANNDNHPLATRAAAIFLISVPSKGAPATEWVSKLSSQPLMVDLNPLEVNHYLQKIDTDWERLLRKPTQRRPNVFCAYERRTTLGVSVVPMVYTSTICDESPWAENKDHFEIVKPSSTDDSIYGWVRGRIASVYQSTLPPPKGEVSIGKPVEVAPEGEPKFVQPEDQQQREQGVPTDGRWQRWNGVWSGHVVWQNAPPSCWGNLIQVIVSNGSFDGNFGSNVVKGQINLAGRVLEAIPNSGRAWSVGDFTGTLENGTITSRNCGGTGRYKLQRQGAKEAEAPVLHSPAAEKLYQVTMSCLRARTATIIQPGKAFSDLYASAVQPKAAAVCVDWQNTTPNRLNQSNECRKWLFVGVNGSCGHRNIEEAKECAITRCRKETGCAHDCVIVDVNDRNALSPPQWWLRRHPTPGI